MEKVIVEKSDGIVHVRINRPEVMNACDGRTYDAIADAWDDSEGGLGCFVEAFDRQFF